MNMAKSDDSKYVQSIIEFTALGVLLVKEFYLISICINKKIVFLRYNFLNNLLNSIPRNKLLYVEDIEIIIEIKQQIKLK